MDRPPPRPFGIKAIVVLLLVDSAIGLTAGVAGVATVVQGEGAIGPLLALSALEQLAMLAGPLVLGLANLLAAVGLLRYKRWAWVLVMLMTGGQLAVDLWQYFAAGDRPYVSMLLNIATVFYLNQSEVQRAFGQRPARPRLLDAPVREAS
jgi:uncharacterized membrane protein (DUF2068 family)